MRTVPLLLLVLLSAPRVAPAEKVALPEEVQPRLVPCALGAVTYDWDFSTDPHGFYTRECDAGGAQVWEHGHTDIIEGAPERVWGTVLNDLYPNDSGAGLVSPIFRVTQSSHLVEVWHYFDVEWGYDGCNLVIYPYGTVSQPIGGYTVPAISESPNYYAWCVDGEPGWTGSSAGWRVDCFDLSDYTEMNIAVEFDFGSDASVTSTGWYISRVRIGGSSPPQGACCDPGTGDCIITTEAACLEMGGQWHAEWTSCDPNPCPQPPPTGACCFADNSCQVLTAPACEVAGGVHYGGGTVCEPNPCGPLEAPYDLTAETQAQDRILLTWVDDSPREDAFLVDRKDGPNGQWETVQVLPANATSWEDLGATQGHGYYYRVRAQDGEELSTFSNFAIATAGVPPAAPSDVVATAVSPVRMDIAWIDNAWNESGFEWQCRKLEFGNWENIKPNPPANSQSAAVGGLIPTATYQVRVRAYNLVAKSPWVMSNQCIMPTDPGSFNANIRVRRGTQFVPGALVYRDSGSGFQLAGQTDAYGTIYITDLKLNDRLRATWTAQTWQTCREYKDAEPHGDMGMRLTLDSDVMNADGNYTVFQVQNVGSEYVLHLVHPIFRFDLAFSTEWDMPANDPYWGSFDQGCQSGSDYLYDVSDGQMALGRIAIWDNKGWWGSVDVEIHNSVWPNADNSQFLECDAVSEDHLYMTRIFDGDEPHVSGWFRTLIHEFGHYGLGLKDEYCAANGGEARMAALKKQYPNSYPSNFGMMDRQFYITELSSLNDYTPNYSYPDPWCSFLPASCRTLQLWVRKMPCWDWVEKKLEGWSSYALITKPQPGWFQNGASTSPDRVGPTDNVGYLSIEYGNSGTVAGPRVEIRRFDSGTGSFERDVVIQNERGPLPDARVYKVSGDAMTYLGETDLRGRLHAVGLKDGDAIRAYARTSTGTLRSEASEIAPGPGTDRLELSLPTAVAAGDGERMYRDDTTAPGASIDAVPSGSPTAAVLTLDIWPDEPLMANPQVVAFYASRVDSLIAEQVPGENHYRASIQIDLSDPAFDGRGIFEVTMDDLAGNRSIFTVPFNMDVARAEEHCEIHRGPADIGVMAEDMLREQIASGASSNTVPFRVPGFAPAPVGDLFSFHLSLDDQYPSSASINIAYDDSLLAGIDERSLRIHGWDATGLQWVPIESSLVSTGSNVVSAVVDAGGVFCVFAEATVDDPVPPARIEDLGAVGVEGLGEIELLWTATGDDGQEGAAQDYIVAYADSAFGGDEWDLLPKIVIPGGGDAPAGTGMTATIHLPQQGHLYYLAIKGKDEASNLSPLSTVTYAISGVDDANFAPAPPTDARAVDTPGDEGGAVTLTWERSYDDGGGNGTVVAYRIYRNTPPFLVPDSLATVPAGTTAYMDFTAGIGQEYLYWVSAADASVETFSPENYAFSARNLGVPVGDFSSDAIVGVDDLGLLANDYAVDSTDVEFEPLFDLDGNRSVFWEDFEIFRSNFGAGGVPSSDPPGENGDAVVLRESVIAGDAEWRLNLTLRGGSNLAGYSFRVSYPHQTLAFVEAIPDSAGVIPNLLTRDGGYTPLFLVMQPAEPPGVLYIANAIQRPSTANAPDGDGFLAHVSFVGSGMDQVQVSDIVLMDCRRSLNYLPTTAGVEDGTTVLRPYLYMNAPNPLRSRTLLRFQVPGRQIVKLRLYDVAGRLVRTLLDGQVDAGRHSIWWDGRSNARHDVPSGVYFYRLETNAYSKARKLVLIR